ncbi:MAG TPA: hypothetical protein VF970_13320 [Gemmatimonadales bacterium]
MAVVEAEAVPAALADVRRRWAELLRRIFEVDRCAVPGAATRCASSGSLPNRA